MSPGTIAKTTEVCSMWRERNIKDNVAFDHLRHDVLVLVVAVTSVTTGGVANVNWTRALVVAPGQQMGWINIRYLQGVAW